MLMDLQMAHSTLEGTRSPHQGLDLDTVEDKIASLLTAIEGETIPDRLLKLANDLQHELVMRRQINSPN